MRHPFFNLTHSLQEPTHGNNLYWYLREAANAAQGCTNVTHVREQLHPNKQQNLPCATTKPQHTAPSCCRWRVQLPLQCVGRNKAPQWLVATQPVGNTIEHQECKSKASGVRSQAAIQHCNKKEALTSGIASFSLTSTGVLWMVRPMAMMLLFFSIAYPG